MANYQIIMQQRPSYREFMFHKKLMHRGDVLFFPPNLREQSFSTDARGFRHTQVGPETLSVADIVKRERYGIVLGTSRVFGIGLEGNENTLPSLLSQRFGFPFANIALPQGSSRNLSSLLFAILARAPHRPSAVIHFSTGDLTGLNYTSYVDPVFGSPNPKQLRTVEEERQGVRPAKMPIDTMLAFTSLWTQFIAQICRPQSIPLVLADDSTFFEKRQPSARDRQFELGTPYLPFEAGWFRGHKAAAGRFYARRKEIADRLGVPLAGPGPSNNLTFIDEFHYDEDGVRALTEDLAGALEPLLQPAV
jgi:hypothetical protein